MLSKGFPPPAKLALAQEHMPPLQGGEGGWLSVIRPKCALPVHSILIQSSSINITLLLHITITIITIMHRPSWSGCLKEQECSEGVSGSVRQVGCEREKQPGSLPPHL